MTKVTILEVRPGTPPTVEATIGDLGFTGTWIGGRSPRRGEIVDVEIDLNGIFRWGKTLWAAEQPRPAHPFPGWPCLVEHIDADLLTLRLYGSLLCLPYEGPLPTIVQPGTAVLVVAQYISIFPTSI
jgi:hypothetical protein